MKKKGRNHRASFKAKVAMEATRWRGWQKLAGAACFTGTIRTVIVFVRGLINAAIGPMNASLLASVVKLC